MLREIFQEKNLFSFDSLSKQTWSRNSRWMLSTRRVGAWTGLATFSTNWRIKFHPKAFASSSDQSLPPPYHHHRQLHCRLLNSSELFSWSAFYSNCHEISSLFYKYDKRKCGSVKGERWFLEEREMSGSSGRPPCLRVSCVEALHIFQSPSRVTNDSRLFSFPLCTVRMKCA